jgi:hypothetical protein
VTVISESWQSAALRALTALSRARRSCRIASTIPSVGLGLYVRGTGERLAGGHLGVDRVVLAAPTPGVRVRTVDLDDVNASCSQLTNERSRVGAGRLNADQRDRPELLQPAPQRSVAGRRRWKRLAAEKLAAPVQGCDDMRVGMRVDATDDLALDLRHAGPAVLSLERAASAGAGGQNSDEALVASRFP